MTAALDKLIAAVEAGGETRTGIEEISAGVFGLSETSVDVGTAYNGSLDAAKALHDALLPGWGCSIFSSPGYGYWICKAVRVEGGLFREEVGHNETNPARAWLLAILRAYRGMQE